MSAIEPVLSEVPVEDAKNIYTIRREDLQEL